MKDHYVVIQTRKSKIPQGSKSRHFEIFSVTWLIVVMRGINRELPRLEQDINLQKYAMLTIHFYGLDFVLIRIPTLFLPITTP